MTLDFKGFLDLFDFQSLIKTHPISLILKTYQSGVNMSKIDCPDNKVDTCHLGKIKRGNFITSMVDKNSVSFKEFYLSQRF
jgi:hypothetical protein